MTAEAVGKYHTQVLADVFKALNSSEIGLSQEEAKRRLEEQGKNALPDPPRDTYTTIFFRQFQSPLIYILLGAAAIMFVLDDAVDALIIFAVLVFNASIGTVQEGRAQNTLAALRKFVETDATVRRDRKEIILPDYNLVTGDIVILQEGEKIPADVRLTQAKNFKVDQAALVGESKPVYKTPSVIHQKLIPIADQENMVFKGTFVAAGHAEGIVVATGTHTEIGKISEKIATIDTEMPLKKDLRQLSQTIIDIVVVIGAGFFVGGLAIEKSGEEMFSTVVAMAVSLIPEGLPVVMTLVLAAGVWRMAKRQALVKRLQAVEALGQAHVIAVDKTGTITKNELIVQQIVAGDKTFEVRGVGYDPHGEVVLIKGDERQSVAAPEFPELVFAAEAAGFTANARVTEVEEDGAKRFRITGDPTEAALLVLSKKIGFEKEILESEHPILQEQPFDYELKYHAIVRKAGKKSLLVVVGAPEVVLAASKHEALSFPTGSSTDYKKQDLTASRREAKNETFKTMSKKGLRVVAFAFSVLEKPSVNMQELPPLVFGGFYGMKDGLRPEVREAMARATAAGVKVVMITGDFKFTAQAIAEEAGIYTAGDETVTGAEIEEMSEDELARRLHATTVFARVTPEHKMRIIQAYRKRGEVVAMTGDGVNDAPSLVAADLGVAMGRIGTEVAKEAADIVLLDDNFGSIISAIEEGRSIYRSIRKVLLYLFSTSLGEVMTIGGALFALGALPLLPGQIIWLNFVTDGFLVAALAMEPKEKGLLKRGMKATDHRLLDWTLGRRMLVMAIPMAVVSVALFYEYAETDMAKALTMTLTTLAIAQWFNAWNCRSEEQSIFTQNPFENKWLVGALCIVAGLQYLGTTNPFLQEVLHTTALSGAEWLLALSAATSVIVVEEIRKLIVRLKKRPAVQHALETVHRIAHA